MLSTMTLVIGEGGKRDGGEGGEGVERERGRERKEGESDNKGTCTRVPEMVTQRQAFT